MKKIYQFNYNDITPFNSKIIKSNTLEKKPLIKRLEEFRYQYLNKSTFIRLVGHYSGIIKSNRNDSCLKRGKYALRSYTYVFGSKGYERDSIKAWQNFEEDIKELKLISSQLGSKFYFFISPIALQLPRKEFDPYFNFVKLDLDCATIDAKSKLQELMKTLKIEIIDPQEYINSQYEDNFNEGNFLPFFFANDLNHPTLHVHGLIAELLNIKIFNKNNQN